MKRVNSGGVIHIYTGWAKKSKPDNFCNNFYCQPIFIIFAYKHTTAATFAVPAQWQYSIVISRHFNRSFFIFYLLCLFRWGGGRIEQKRQQTFKIRPPSIT